MCEGWSLERKGSRLLGARLNGAGSSFVLVVEALAEGGVDLKARALDFCLGGIMRSLVASVGLGLLGAPIF